MWRGYRKQGHLQWCWGPVGRQTELLPAGWAPPGPQQHQSGAGRWHLPICPRISHAAEPEQLSVPCQAPMCPALALALDGTIG